MGNYKGNVNKEDKASGWLKIVEDYLKTKEKETLLELRGMIF